MVDCCNCATAFLASTTCFHSLGGNKRFGGVYLQIRQITRIKLYFSLVLSFYVNKAEIQASFIFMPTFLYNRRKILFLLCFQYETLCHHYFQLENDYTAMN